ncbi:hypothetical protein MtrunA17_Chr4g0054631 [Medicago truncatula]|uniref:Uncharacterized protein n=1 Tax=Medicago truncatula TaxID=3880 RepID=A0A396IBX9_MEDTR|nr:hypothetical protein MtrunA17_Chr4g0054631 [Medicago truncatula]
MMKIRKESLRITQKDDEFDEFVMILVRVYVNVLDDFCFDL